MRSKLFAIVATASSLAGCSGWEPVQLVEPDVSYNRQHQHPPYYTSTTPAPSGASARYALALDPLWPLDADETGLTEMLEAVLPTMEAHIAKHYPAPMIPREQVTKGMFVDAKRYAEEYAGYPAMQPFDIPKINFGDIQWVVDWRWDYADKPTSQQLTVIDATTAWSQAVRGKLEQASADYVLDIHLGIIEVEPNDGMLKDTYPLGTHTTTEITGFASPVYGPSNVIAFKGMLIDKNGHVVKGGVEGFAPIIRPNSDYPLLSIPADPGSLSYDPQWLDVHLLNYDWQSALEELLAQLVPS